MNTKGNIEIERISGDTDSANYYKTITDKVRALALFDTASEQKGEVVIVFALSKEGSLIGEPTIVKTDNPNLDKFAIRAVKEASPFPPFPASMGQVQEKFKINLSYR
jgi:protein TonB